MYASGKMNFESIAYIRPRRCVGASSLLAKFIFSRALLSSTQNLYLLQRFHRRSRHAQFIG
jgi:hypothetical protein